MNKPWPADLFVRPMSPEDADTMANWHYEGRWAIYDLHGRAPAAIEAYRSLVSRSGGHGFVGFFCVGEEARVPGLDVADGTLDLGWGMNPALVGQGHGVQFGAAVLAGARQEYGEGSVRVVIQSWNERSIRVAGKLGFIAVGTHICTQSGRDVQYEVMLHS